VRRLATILMRADRAVVVVRAELVASDLVGYTMGTRVRVAPFVGWESVGDSRYVALSTSADECFDVYLSRCVRRLTSATLGDDPDAG
jgi:hypothetical protein